MTRLILQHPTLADDTVARFARQTGSEPSRRSPGIADWKLARIDEAQARALAEQMGVDLHLAGRLPSLSDYRLLVFDMDSTLITIECIDEIADYAGRKAQVAAITEAAMRGEITDFNESLRRRVALLKGLPVSVLDSVYRERLQLTPGAATLIDAAHGAGLKVLLVSGGFTYFTERLKPRLGLDFIRANRLGITDGKLDGEVAGEGDGDIVNAQVKRRVVEETCARLGCSLGQAIVVGDGANDLQMMSIAGMSVAFHAKPVVRAHTTHAVNHCGLDAILNFFAQ